MDASHVEMYRRMKEHSRELDLHISNLRQKLLETESNAHVQLLPESRIAQYEDRLHDLLQRFNQTVASNSELKENIDLLRKEKNTYESIRNRMQQELEMKVDETTGIVERSKAAYAARDNAKVQMDQLKQQADREHAEFQKEWQELAKLLENDKRMREFVHQKEVQKQIQRRPIKSTARESASENMSTNPTHRSQTKVARVEELEKLFGTLQSATGITSIEDLLKYFIEKEKSNYSLFALCSLNMKQIDSVKTRIQYVSSDMERFRSSMHSSITLPGYQYVDSPPTTASPTSTRDVGLLEKDLVASEGESDQLENQTKSLAKLIGSVRAIVQSCLRRVFPNISECARYVSQSVIASSAGQTGIPLGNVTEANIVDYLASIEMRVDELAATYGDVFPKMTRINSIKKSFAARGSQRRSMLALPTAAVVQAGVPGNPLVMNRILQYKLPSATDDDQESVSDNSKFREDVGGDNTRPLTRDELRSRTILAIQRSQDKLRFKKSHSKLV